MSKRKQIKARKADYENAMQELNDVRALLACMRTGGTRRQTRPAADAFCGLEAQFRPRAIALGIVTPLAPQRASLKEQRGANARPIVHGKPLHIEQNSRFHVDSALSRNFLFSIIRAEAQPVNPANGRFRPQKAAEPPSPAAGRIEAFRRKSPAKRCWN